MWYAKIPQTLSNKFQYLHKKCRKIKWAKGVVTRIYLKWIIFEDFIQIKAITWKSTSKTDGHETKTINYTHV